MDSMAEVIAPEMPRERALWGNDVALWESNLEMVRDYIRGNDLQTLGVEHVSGSVGQRNMQADGVGISKKFLQLRFLLKIFKKQYHKQLILMHQLNGRW